MMVSANILHFVVTTYINITGTVSSPLSGLYIVGGIIAAGQVRGPRSNQI